MLPTICLFYIMYGYYSYFTMHVNSKILPNSKLKLQSTMILSLTILFYLNPQPNSLRKKIKNI